MKVLDAAPDCGSVKFCCWAEEGTVCLYQDGTNPTDPFRESSHCQGQPFILGSDAHGGGRLIPSTPDETCSAFDLLLTR